MIVMFINVIVLLLAHFTMIGYSRPGKGQSDVMFTNLLVVTIEPYKYKYDYVVSLGTLLQDNEPRRE